MSLKQVIYCSWILVVLLAASSVSAFGITINQSAYKDVVIEIQDTVPMDQCAQVLNDLEVSFRAKVHFNQKRSLCRLSWHFLLNGVNKRASHGIYIAATIRSPVHE